MKLIVVPIYPGINFNLNGKIYKNGRRGIETSTCPHCRFINDYENIDTVFHIINEDTNEIIANVTQPKRIFRYAFNVILAKHQIFDKDINIIVKCALALYIFLQKEYNFNLFITLHHSASHILLEKEHQHVWVVVNQPYGNYDKIFGTVNGCIQSNNRYSRISNVTKEPYPGDEIIHTDSAEMFDDKNLNDMFSWLQKYFPQISIDNRNSFYFFCFPNENRLTVSTI